MGSFLSIVTNALPSLTIVSITPNSKLKRDVKLKKIEACASNTNPKELQNPQHQPQDVDVEIFFLALEYIHDEDAEGMSRSIF